MTHKSNNAYPSHCVMQGGQTHNNQNHKPLKLFLKIWNTACLLYWHAAFAVNKLSGGASWHATALTMAIANTIPAPAGNSPTAPLLLTKWAGLSGPATTSTTSTVSKLTTVIPTLLSFRHLHMPKSTKNKPKTKCAAGLDSAARAMFQGDII